MDYPSINKDYVSIYLVVQVQSSLRFSSYYSLEVAQQSLKRITLNGFQCKFKRPILFFNNEKRPTKVFLVTTNVKDNDELTSYSWL